jgi:hypothetical protein
MKDAKMEGYPKNPKGSPLHSPVYTGSGKSVSSKMGKVASSRKTSSKR